MIKTGFIPKIAFSVLGIEIYWYAVLITMAIIIAILWCRHHDGRYHIKFNDIFDLVIFLIPISIICARLYYVLFGLDYFLCNPIQIVNIKNGGLAIYGGIIGGVITIYIFCKKRKIKFLDLLDYIVPVLSLGQAIGRIGNYINIEAYGRQTNLPIKMEITVNGVVEYVHPTFLYESILTFLLFFILSNMAKKRKFSGQITYFYIIIYSFARIFIENLRTDSSMLNNYRISEILSIVFFIIFSVFLSIAMYKHRKLS